MKLYSRLKMSDDIIEIVDCTKEDKETILCDSDCEIQETEVTVIEVDDSHDSVDGDPRLRSLENNQPPGTIFKISFNDEAKFETLKECIMVTLKDCLKKNGIHIDFVEDEHLLDVCAIETDGIEDEEPVENLFAVDTTPADKLDAGTIPSYKRSIKDVLKENAKNETEDKDCSWRKAPNTCFNCSGNHNLKDCPKPRDSQRISRARKQFQGPRTERYHVDIDQKFAHLKPGQFSNNLKRALGLRNGELPSFIYKMRVLGYPPGWLEEAKVAHSGITLFDSEGREVLDSEKEEGEYETEKHKYDVTKIISFPGFNVDPGPGYLDDYKYYDAPPMRRKDCKEQFIKSLGDNIVKGYKRKKLKHLTALDTTVQIEVQPTDMEIEDVEEAVVPISVLPPLPPPLPPEEAPPPPPEVPPKAKAPAGMEDDIDILPDSPSLEDLEAKQKQILAALANSSSLVTPEDSLIDEVLELETSEDNSQTSEACSEQNDNSFNSTTCSSLQTTSTSAANTKTSILGTPILKFSPYDKLPEGDSFKKGVSDVINFENLPDSTGKYEQMKVVIKKVRTVITKLNEEN